MKIYQFILILIGVYLLGIATIIDFNKFPIRKEYVRIEVCPRIGFNECIKLGGIPIVSDNPYTTEPESCEFIK